MSMFKKAERKQVKLKIALTGPSGSGKTMSALLLAMGIGKKIAVIDTENGSASLYADRFDFDTIVLKSPYTVAKYLEAMNAASAAGFDVLIIDQISHAWAGEGGLLAKKEALDSRGGSNSYTNWGGITKEHEQFKSAILNYEGHLICTMRSKQDYVLEQNEKGKSVPKKVGMAPIQREGMEYEFTTVFDLAMDHYAQSSKDRTSLFDGQLFKITPDTGALFMKWLSVAKPTQLQLTELFDLAKQLGMAPPAIKEIMTARYPGVQSSLDLSQEQCLDMKKHLLDLKIQNQNEFESNCEALEADLPKVAAT